MEVELRLMVSPKLQQLFPSDPHFDFTLSIHNRQYKLQRAHLRIESDFFRKLFDDNPQQQLFEINIKCEPLHFEKVLRCFYGGSYKVPWKEIYPVYEIVSVLEMENLTCLLEDFLLQNVNDCSIFLVYKIGVKYQRQTLKEKCEQYLAATKFAALRSDDVFDRNNFKFPVHVPDLDHGMFKQLLKFHNQSRCGAIPFVDQYTLIKKYCLAKYAQPEEQIASIRQTTEEIIDKLSLNAQEYKQIYHQELFISESKVSSLQSIQQNQSSVMSIYAIPQAQDLTQINLLRSENILYQKEMEELKRHNQSLVSELSQIKSEMQEYLSQVKSFRELEKEVNKKLVTISSEYEKRDKESFQRISSL